MNESYHQQRTITPWCGARGVYASGAAGDGSGHKGGDTTLLLVVAGGGGLAGKKVVGAAASGAHMVVWTEGGEIYLHL